MNAVDVRRRCLPDENVDVGRDQDVDDERKDRQPPALADRDQNCSWRPNTVRRPLCKDVALAAEELHAGVTLTFPYASSVGKAGS